MQNLSEKSYWAARPTVDVIRQIAPYNSSSQSWANNPMWAVWSRNYFSYYSTVVRPQNWDTGLVFRGKQGELIEVLVPMAKSIVQQIIDIICKQKLVFKGMADATAQNVIQTARLGSALARQIVREQSVDLKWSMALENEFLTGLGFMYAKWRTDRGGVFGRDSMGQVHFNGEAEISIPTVYDVVFDPNIPNPLDWQWVQVREIMNRWDLIAQFPDLRDALIALPSVRQNTAGAYTTANYAPSDDDNVYIYALYHLASPALDKGRMVIYGDEKTVLVDRENVYGELPLYTSRGKPIPLTSYGDPLFSQLLASQEMLDTTVSAVCTNNAAFAVQNVISPRGAGINVEQILGMNWFQYTPESIPGGGKPEALQLTKSAPETFKLMEIMEGYLMKLSNMNAALRGDPPSGASGVAIATLTATAMESINASAKSSRAMLQRCMNGAINCYRRFASTPRSIQISGIGNQTKLSEFRGSDLDAMKMVELQEVNPLMQTLAGRIQMAQDMLGSGLITNGRGYFAVIEGAPEEEMYKNELSEEDLVNRENEEMVEGRPVPALAVDDHPYHILMHKSMLNDPKIRRDQMLAGLILQHIEKHNQLEKGTDPALIAMARTGKAPDPMLLQPPMAPPVGEGSLPEPGQKPPQAQISGPNEKGTVKPAMPAQDLLKRQTAAGA